MRLFSLGRTKITCNPLVIGLVAVFALLELFSELLIALAALSFHEAAHAITAKRLGYSILSIELEPFGFVAHIGGTMRNASDELAIFGSGIIFSLLSACVSYSVCYFFGHPPQLLLDFAKLNITIAAVNLAPALALDGGRIFKALLSKKYSEGSVTKLLLFMSYAASATLVAVGAVLAVKGMYNLTFFTMGFFLCISALNEKKRGVPSKLKSGLARSFAISSGETLEVNHFAMHRSIYAKEAVKAMREYKYNVVLVLDDYMNYIGRIDEIQLIIGAAREQTLEEILKESQKYKD